MSTKVDTTKFILDQLGSMKDVRVRAMFGEYALYCQDKVVALICDDEVFMKITDPGKEYVGDKFEEGIPYKGARPYMHISGDLLEDTTFFQELVLITAKALPKRKPKK